MIDFNKDLGRASKSGEIELILQQIDILFDTTPGEVFGSIDFGTQYDSYLYDLKLSGENIKQRVQSDLNSIDLFGFIPEVDVYLLQGTERDIALIDINLHRNGEHYNKTYSIS